MMKQLSYILVLTIFGFSCTGEKANSNSETSEPKAQEKMMLSESACLYEYVNENTSVEWTAYKTNDKVPVGGKFDEMSVMSAQGANDPLSILEGVKFEIPTSSTNTNLEERDTKIKTYFFGNMSASELITGRVVGLEGDENSGRAVVEISMNGLSKEVEAKYTIDGQQVDLTTEFDVETWDGAAAIAALNEVCLDLHKGSDGVSKLWSTVSVKVSTSLAKQCD